MAIILTANGNVEVNDIYSWKNYTGVSLHTAVGLTNCVIYQSCFSQETPNSNIFPVGMTGITFLNCNLDNVLVPVGNTIIGGTNRHFQVQEDGLDWEIDVDGNALRVLNGT